jgi:hypothetical protein
MCICIGQVSTDYMVDVLMYSISWEVQATVFIVT